MKPSGLGCDIRYQNYRESNRAAHPMPPSARHTTPTAPDRCITGRHTFDVTVAKEKIEHHWRDKIADGEAGAEASPLGTFLLPLRLCNGIPPKTAKPRC